MDIKTKAPRLSKTARKRLKKFQSLPREEFQLYETRTEFDFGYTMDEIYTIEDVVRKPLLTTQKGVKVYERTLTPKGGEIKEVSRQKFFRTEVYKTKTVTKAYGYLIPAKQVERLKFLDMIVARYGSGENHWELSEIPRVIKGSWLSNRERIDMVVKMGWALVEFEESTTTRV